MAFRIERDAEPIPGYQLVEPLGRGGFGEVWKARAPGGILKAIKFVFGDLETLDAAKMGARQELRSLARVKDVRHPFLLSLERFDIVEGQLVIVTELADGDLWGRFRACRAQGLAGIPRDELLGYMEESAEVLDLMNTQYDLQHMDVKPQNLCLMHNHVKVADFGLVKDLTGLVASVTGGLTPKYAPPETFRGMVSRYSDQYSLAIVYQELLTGAHPYSATTLQELMRLHTEGEPNLVPLPVRDRAAVGKALAKEPTRRHASCRAFVRALREADVPPAPAAAPPVPAVRPALTDTPTRSLTARTFPVTPTETGPPLPEADEVRGEGVLRPALVVGVGSFGLEVLRQFRRELSARFSGPDALPHLQFLGLDTDPAAADQALRGAAEEALLREQVLVARLNRASHYMRPRDNLPALGEWLPAKAVHRLGRDLLANGSRALGRLAFVDNYRAIAPRLRRDLERVTEPGALEDAVRESGLGWRSNWPRLYLVAGLGGGTGSGMLLDLAYLARAVLRKLGYGKAEVVGLLLLPPTGDGPGTALSQANAYAALAELTHFARGEVFQARYEARGAAVEGVGPALDRAVVLSALGDPAGAAGEYLYRELLTDLGREAEQARPPCEARGAMYDAVGLHALASPRHGLLGAGVRCLAQALVGRWVRRCDTELATKVRQAVQDRLHAEGLDPQGALTHFQAECTRHLGKTPVETAAGWVESLAPAGSPWLLDLGRVDKVLRQIEGLLGTPEEEALQSAPVPVVLRDTAEEAGRRARQVLAELITGQLDSPGGRLTAATEAVRQAVALVERWLQVQESLATELGPRVRQLTERIQAGVLEAERAMRAGGKRGDEGRRTRALVDLAADLAEYPRVRYQQALVTRLAGLYLSLRGFLSDQVREVGYFQQPLNALQWSLAESTARETFPVGPQGGLAGGEGGPAAVAQQLVGSMSAEDWLRLDRAVQQAVNDRPNGLTSVAQALGSTQGLKALGGVLLKEAGRYMAERLSLDKDVAEFVLARHADAAGLEEAIRKAYEAAAPPAETPLPVEREVTLVLAPASEAGERFLEAARQALPGVHAVPSADREEIVFCRAWVGLTLGELEQFGLISSSAYLQACATENFTPHSRLDVHWRGLAEETR